MKSKDDKNLLEAYESVVGSKRPQEIEVVGRYKGVMDTLLTIIDAGGNETRFVTNDDFYEFPELVGMPFGRVIDFGIDIGLWEPTGGGLAVKNSGKWDYFLRTLKQEPSEDHYNESNDITKQQEFDENLAAWIRKRVSRELPQDRDIREDLVKLAKKLDSIELGKEITKTNTEEKPEENLSRAQYAMSGYNGPKS